tara:strand:+ start:793 stop:978 length:186 start_codon:yes stop_codon:yes gene_type:complete
MTLLDLIKIMLSDDYGKIPEHKLNDVDIVIVDKGVHKWIDKIKLEKKFYNEEENIVKIYLK